MIFEPVVEQIHEHRHELGLAAIALLAQDEQAAQERLVILAVLDEERVGRTLHLLLLAGEVRAHRRDQLVEMPGPARPSSRPRRAERRTLEMSAASSVCSSTMPFWTATMTPQDTQGRLPEVDRAESREAPGRSRARRRVYMPEPRSACRGRACRPSARAGSPRGDRAASASATSSGATTASMPDARLAHASGPRKSPKGRPRREPHLGAGVEQLVEVVEHQRRGGLSRESESRAYTSKSNSGGAVGRSVGSGMLLNRTPKSRPGAIVRSGSEAGESFPRPARSALNGQPLGLPREEAALEEGHRQALLGEARGQLFGLVARSGSRAPAAAAACAARPGATRSLRAGCCTACGQVRALEGGRVARVDGNDRAAGEELRQLGAA